MAQSCKVLMLVENLSVPADPRVWREARTLRRAGFQVSVICPQGQTRDQESYVCLEGIHIHRYRLPETAGYMKEYAIAMLKTFWLSLKVWLQHGFDVIHAANPPDTFFAIALLYRILGKKYVFDQHDLAPAMFHVKFLGRMKLLARLLQFFERCSYTTAHLIITTNASQQRHAVESSGCSPEKVVIVRNGPDLARFGQVKQVVAKPGQQKGQRYLLAYVGVMSIQDGVEYVLGALDELVHKRRRQDVTLILMGEGDQVPMLKSLVHTLNLDDYVNFTGWLTMSDLMCHLASADIGLCPDPSNELNDRSTMIKTMEYMALGKPVVAFDLPETRFSAQEAALYAIPNNVEDFADKIELLLADEALRLQMGALGRKRIEEELCWEHTHKNLLAAYELLFPGSTNRVKHWQPALLEQGVTEV